MEEKYCCPECGWRGNEPLCPVCNLPADSLEVNEVELAGGKTPKYSDGLLDQEVKDRQEEKAANLEDEEF